MALVNVGTDQLNEAVADSTASKRPMTVTLSVLVGVDALLASSLPGILAVQTISFYLGRQL